MIFQSHYLTYSNNSTINTVCIYKNIMNNFVIKFIKKNKFLNKNEIYADALIYSKYYLYWKIYDCVYSDDIMNILFDIEFL